ncbi:hypothetical protein Tco_1146467 [Tanacetum coccineum]
MSTPKFAETNNLVAFLEKPEESNGFEEIIDFLNASYVQYALSVNPTIYTTCIKQFWTSAKVKLVNGKLQIQALVDKKKVIISETSIRSDLKLDDAKGINCLPTAIIFAELERIGCIMPKSTDVDHHDTAYYIPMYHRTEGFTREEREVYKSLLVLIIFSTLMNKFAPSSFYNFTKVFASFETSMELSHLDKVETTPTLENFA